VTTVNQMKNKQWNNNSHIGNLEVQNIDWISHSCKLTILSNRIKSCGVKTNQIFIEHTTVMIVTWNAMGAYCWTDP